MSLTAGVAGISRHGCVALSDRTGLLAVCEQERVTRARAAGCNPTGLPDEALDAVLQQVHQTRADVRRYVRAGADGDNTRRTADEIGRHFAHAATSYLSSPFSAATIVVCDHHPPAVSVWRGRGGELAHLDRRWRGPGFADVYSRCAEIFGFYGEAGSQRLEALARLAPGFRDPRVDRLVQWKDGELELVPGWEGTIEDLVPKSGSGSWWLAAARVASAVQTRIADLVLELLADVRHGLHCPDLCVGGSFFYHSSINSAIRQAGLFERVFVPVDPGEAGLAVGAALFAQSALPSAATPFLGPSYESYEVKETLDNCKLQYSWESEDSAIGIAVDALLKGTLVAWFDGPMEWGPRALGGRCIFANPFSPYVLENLNRFLKCRQPWRGYALSGLEASVREHFDGACEAPFMECDYRPVDPARFRHVLSAPGAALRVHTVGSQSPGRFRRLLEAFGAKSGVPVLVNTSFNGFHEPIVCSPRDAVRVFYGSGLDLLVLDRFVLRK